MKTQEVRYLDMADPKNACTSILVNDFVLIPSGTTVYAMPVTDKNPEYNLRLYSSKGDNMRLDVHRLMSSHVETVVRLDKKKTKEYVEIGVDAEDYYKIKDSEEAR